MIRIHSILLEVHENFKNLKAKIIKELGISEKELLGFHIVKRSIDARKKPTIFYSYAIDVEVEKEEKVLQKYKKSNNIQKSETTIYNPVCTGIKSLSHRPVIVGFGPAGIFSALLLARLGFSPLVIERGEDVDTRFLSVEKFWEIGELDLESNVSFGEGGAGTFSDGKLNTLVKDKIGRNTYILQTLVEFGADKDILIDQKPHIGTDVLKGIVKNIRKEIIRLGGEISFSTKLTDIAIDNGRIIGITIEKDKKSGYIPTEILILAIGHSARDTFRFLYERDVYMEAKAFAIGVRIQHPQSLIDISQFGEREASFLSPATYKLTGMGNGRGVYSFCMCPGGYVVNASTQRKKLAINGMSYHNRDSGVANAAIIVTVEPKDFLNYIKDTSIPDVLKGVAFQEYLEHLAYTYGKGCIPTQRLKDFLEGRDSTSFGSLSPKFRGNFSLTRVDLLLPVFITDAIKEAMIDFNKKIKGFSMDDAIISAIESRTSSPVRIKRDENLESNIAGLYPCGEGAGYAGGITSAAMDGLKVAERIAFTYTYELGN